MKPRRRALWDSTLNDDHSSRTVTILLLQQANICSDDTMQACNDSNIDWDSPEATPTKIQHLQLELSGLVDRDTIADSTLDHECY
jgi:hypothetical protein